MAIIYINFKKRLPYLKSKNLDEVNAILVNLEAALCLGER